MIMSSGRFSSGGGGGGSNRDVVFTAKVVTDPKVRQELANLSKQIDDVARKAANIRLGASGGIAGSGRPGAGGRGGGGSVTGSIVFDDGGAESRRQAQFFDRAIREEQRILKQNAAERAKDLRMLKKDTKDVMEGMIGLSRAFVLFGVSSEENLEKAVRALAKFEGAIAGIKGGMKLSEGLGGLLGRGAPLIGMKAGAGGIGLGAAGVAAGVGVLGGGLAIADLIRGRGAYSEGHANFFTGLARRGLENGIDLSGRGGQLAGAFNPLLGIFNATGYTGAVYGRARSEMAYERGAVDRAGYTGQLLKESQQRLAIEQQILSLMDREVTKQRDATAAAENRLQGTAFAYQGLSGRDQRAVGRLRDKFLSDPSSIDSRRLQALLPFVGQAEQEQIGRLLRQRTQGYIAGGGFSREREAELNRTGEGGRIIDQAELQREITVKLQVENEEAAKSFAEATAAALKVANEELAELLQKRMDEVVEAVRQSQQQQKNQINATLSGYSGYYGN